MFYSLRLFTHLKVVFSVKREFFLILDELKSCITSLFLSTLIDGTRIWRSALAEKQPKYPGFADQLSVSHHRVQRPVTRQALMDIHTDVIVYMMVSYRVLDVVHVSAMG